MLNRGTNKLGRLIAFCALLSFGILLAVSSVGLVVRLINHLFFGGG